MTDETPTTLDANDLACEMSGRAFQALAILFEMANPGEYLNTQMKIRRYVIDSFRSVEATLDDDVIARENFRAAVLRVRTLLDETVVNVERMSETADAAGGAEHYATSSAS